MGSYYTQSLWRQSYMRVVKVEIDGGWGRKLHELENKIDEAYEIQHPITGGRGVQ